MYLKQENQYSIFDEYDVALYNRIFILNIVKNMNVRDRVLIGFLILRKNYDEIGRALGINEEQVKERVYNLREKIECLFPELFNIFLLYILNHTGKMKKNSYFCKIKY